MKRLLALALATLILPLTAADRCENLEIGAHGLVFIPMACEYDYVVNMANPQTDTAIRTARCGIDWGFRLFGQYDYNCYYTGLSFQWYESTAKERAPDLETDSYMSRNGFFGTQASAELKLRYNHIDLRLGHHLWEGCGYRFHLFGNARWVDLRYRRANRVVDTVTVEIAIDARETARLRGGALGVGAGSEIDLCLGFQAFGEANLLGIIADRSTNQVFVGNTDMPSPISYPSETCITPEASIKLGISYTKTYRCLKLVGEVGYELDYFWSAFAFPKGLNVDSEVSDLVRTCEDVGFSGFFFGARAMF